MEKVISSRLVKSADLNSYGTLFGGKLMAWMDEIAVILCMRYTCRECVTVTFTNIVFMKPVYLNDMIDLEASIVETNNSSMTVSINVFRNSFEKKQEKIGSGDAIFVALDENKKPTSDWRTCCKN